MIRRILVLGALLWHSPSWAAYQPPEDAPNVILIVTDDQGYGDIAAHGNPLLKTPHLDRLHASSITLEDYHVDPVCTPTRAALMTGRYCGRTSAWNVVHGRQLMHAREATMADIFRDSGYDTAMFGKWHLGDPWPYNPGTRGFQEVVCCRAGGVDEIGNPVGNDYFDDVYYRNGTAEQFEGYCTDVFVEETIDFIRSRSEQGNSKPFFVYLATNAMHSPFTVADEYAVRFREQGLPENRAKFYGMVENFDENLGRLLTTLKQLDISDNTIVIFMGDNGTAANSGSEGAFNAGMRGDKGSVYEGGHRVACFVRWPAGLTSTHALDQLTCHRDWLPTLIDLCGLNKPANIEFDGHSLASLLRNQHGDWPERTLIIERQGTEAVEAFTADKPNQRPYAVLTERWRLVNGELYDIQDDPAQTTDLADEHPEVVESLKSEYRAYYADVFSNASDEACFIAGAPEEPATVFTARDWRPTKGKVIWEMKQLERDDIFIQGFWPLEVVAPGDYQIEFARYPFEQARPIGAREAHLEIGDLALTKQIEPAATSVSIVVTLPVGKRRLSGRLKNASTDRTRGPYYVRIKKLTD